MRFFHRQSARSLVALCWLALGILASSAEGAGTFGYRRQITLAGVVGGPHADFPVLISLVDPNLRTVGNGGRVESANGYDIVFTAADGTTPLDHEIERWNGATGELLSWVRVPSLSAGTLIFLYYGNNQILSATETPGAVWNRSYVGVWHLKEAGNGTLNEFRDSSRYGNHGQGGKGVATATPSQVAGAIGYGLHFDNADGTYDFVDGGDDGTLNVTGNQITFEAWVKHNITVGAAHGTPPGTNTPYGILAHKGYNDGYSLWLLGDTFLCPGGPVTEPCVVFNLPGQSDSLRTSQTAPMGPNVWHHLVATYDGGTMTIFIDGASQATGAKVGNVSPSNAEQSMWIGHGDLPNNVPWSGQYEGELDEVRISQVSRSASWVATAFANQSSPGTFETFGAETPVATSLSTVTVNYRSIGTNAGTLYSTGDASVGVGATTVTLAGGASLPANLGRGDILTFTGAPAETLFILSRDSATQLTLQSAASSSHTNQTYTITRAFNTLAGWEAGRGGNLVAGNRSEVGVAYNDGPFTAGVIFSGSTTDPARSLKLTAPQGQSHLGRAGTGVVLDNGASGSPAIQILDDYVTVEWLEIKGGSGAGAHGVELASGINPANRAIVRYNIIHDTGGDGVRIGDPDAVADIYNNVIYEASNGIHLSVDMTADARVNLFSNTVYSCNAAGGPSGIKSSVRQTSFRADLRNNIAHSNANGDFGVAPFFDRGYFCNPGCTQIGNGGTLGPTEFLADRSNDTTLNFTTVGTSCLYLGSSTKFRGLDYVRATPAAGGVSLSWSYWNGATWAAISPFNDGTFTFQYNGAVYWPDDPVGWATTSVSGSPALYYVQGCLAGGSYTTLPVESEIVRSDVSTASRNNLASDITGFAHSFLAGGGSGMDLIPLGSMSFFNTTAGVEDLHISPGSAAENVAFDLSRLFTGDIDGALRAAPWDIGADDASATTAVTLRSFAARGGASAVDLTWETSSELDNLGFHLYRSLSAAGPFERITSSLIPGLGSSPVGASYRYRDPGLAEGVTYYYELEDVDTQGGSERHGPVSAAPDGPGSDTFGTDSSSSLTYGEPSASSLRVVSRDARQIVLELTTRGFFAEPQDDGSVRLSIPDFVVEEESGSPAIPVRRSLLDVGSGRGVRVLSIQAEEIETFSSLRPTAADAPEVFASRSGTIRAGRRREPQGAGFHGGLYPAEAARLMSVGYQGESRKALVELAPLRWDGASGQLVLARRLTVRLSLVGRPEPGHRESAAHGSKEVGVRLVAREKGLYGVSYEQLFSKRGGLDASSLRLSRLGESVAFHLEPNTSRFGPCSMLYFLSGGESLNPYGHEAVYELEAGVSGTSMRVVSAAPSGAPVSRYWQKIEREENHYYQAALLEAKDPWLWDLLFAPVKKSYSFQVEALAEDGRPSRLEVRLQGVSDMPETPDHHLRFTVNGVPVGEATLDGKNALDYAADIPSGTIREGDNAVEIENVGDTGAAYSMVMLDRFSVSYPHKLAVSFVLDGRFFESGAATVEGLGGRALALDVSDTKPLWLRGGEASSSGLRLRVEADRKYFLASRESVLRPSVVRPRATRLKSDRNQADYLVVGPKDLLEAARPLLDWRRSQGLETLAVSVDDIYSDFGFGETRPEAVREFLAYAYHHWRKPAPRYVLLLGDGTYDFKDYLGTGVKNQVPPLLIKTSYLWTASDPAFAAVNGDDILPDLAIGRLAVASPEGARAMVEKILSYEKLEADSMSPVVMVADNPDAAGNFEAHAEEIVSALPAASSSRRIYLSRLGTEAARSEILDAFDRGAALLSYVGHGGIQLWASENIFDVDMVSKLQPQAREPLVLTLNCLNGYFPFPYFDSLAEELVEAPSKGAIAAFSPTGLSLDGPAHLFHQALVTELLSGRHQRLGDAILAAQSRYAASGAFPELLSIYHLLGDPALRLR